MGFVKNPIAGEKTTERKVLRVVDSVIQGKKVLLLYARFFGYDVIVKEKLESMGAKVDLYDARAEIGTVGKAIKKIDPRFYYKKQRRFHAGIREKLSNNQYDYVFSNENIEVETLQGYRNVFPNATFVLYLDDSVTNMKGVDKSFHMYDRVLTFDRRDAENYHLLFRPLFFCDTFKDLNKKDCLIENDICFVGTCHSDRLSIIDKIVNDHPKYRCDWYCYLQSAFMYHYYYLRDPEYRSKKMSDFAYKQLSMKDVAEKMAKASTILDIQHPKQTGLTMRTIETLGLGRKIITTNSDIKDYDFFDSHNILVIDRQNPVIPDEFIASSYKPISDELYQKYSIEGWIAEIFR